jgi:phosphoribosylformimino-5-aminoimidazole carboxamide ribotide isomerase
MDVIPAIDLRGGRCVRLVQGDYDRELVFSDDPVATARRWVGQGAARLHVVDLDGAREGRPVNDAAVRAIIAAVSVPVQVAGGVRDLDAVERWLAAGADRVVLGTAAVRDPQLAGEASRRYGERTVVSVDARDGIVAVEGWTEATALRANELLARLAGLGVPRFVYTDIAADGTFAGPNYDAIEALARATEAPIIAAGGVGAVEHLVRLATTGVEGAIVGRALYDGRIDLGEALRAVGNLS